MFCVNCGKEIDEKAEICPHCGVRVKRSASAAFENDAPSAGFAVLCFFFPVIGLILYLIWKDDFPLRAKSCGKGALVSVIVSAALVVLYIVILVCALGCIAASVPMV